MSANDDLAAGGARAGAAERGGAWLEGFYDELLAEVLLVREPAELEGTLAFLLGALGVAPGARLFDQCCGIGSLALPLAARGFEVAGVDLCAPYVERARREAESAGLAGRCRLEAADARAYVPARPCDGAFNWWTGLGHAGDDEGDRAMVRRAFEALRPGGRFALDYMNVPGVLRGFRPRVVTERATPLGEVTLVRESEIDLGASVMRKRWAYHLAGRPPVVKESRLRLYYPHELAAMLAGAGFADLRLLGGESSAPLGLDSPRCVAVATRPA
ncbi:MAG TPA: class I SAM-dependent methyltransferase [Polyangiaceae bacterium]|nr:class I SAM-dependent methyltransferase [Polyangiaceae bacterium]